MKKAIVVGAGVAGLGSSIRLAKLGYNVTVFDANPFVGGKINSKKSNGYRFDMGPSVFTGPNYVKDLYDLCGKDFSSFEYQKLEHSFTYFYPDGQTFTVPADHKQQIEVLSKELKEDKKVLERYLKKSKNNYNLIAPLFIESSLHRWKHLMKKSLFCALAHLPSYKLGKTMHEENKRFFRNNKTVQFFDRFATYNGSNPYQAPAMLNMIAHLELNEGAFLPKHGMVQIPEALKTLAEEQGVNFILGEKVEEILVENNSVKGVSTNNGNYDADVVYSNMDVAFTYEKLMPNAEQPTKILDQEKSSSAIVFYFGIKKSFSQLGVHNIFFSENYKEEFDSIFEKNELYNDPTIYVNITSKEVKTDAPEGCENWFVMINSSVDKNTDWETTTKKAREILIKKLSKHLKTDIEALIETEDVMNPQIIEQKYSGKQGSIYGNASNNKYAAFYRHANFSKKIKGLYFVGVTVHPGGGIPLALNSAKIATQCLQEDLK